MSAKSLDRVFKSAAMKDIGMVWGCHCCGPKDSQHRKQAHKTSRRTMKKMTQEELENHYGREGDEYVDYEQ